MPMLSFFFSEFLKRSHYKLPDLGVGLDKISFAFDNALTRKPSNEEIKVILDLLKNQRKRYKEDEKAAIELLKTGMKAYDTSIETSELAAWTSISRTLLNMYETTARL